MTVIGSAHARLRQNPSSVYYASVAPRSVLWAGQIASVLTDANNGNVYGFVLTSTTGTPSLCDVNMDVGVGIAPGDDSIGLVRLRKTISGSTIYINETPYGDIPFSTGDWVTVYNSFTPSNKAIRLVGIKEGGSAYVNNFIEYHDYDIVYTTQNDVIAPIVNIHSGPISGVPQYPALSGFVETSGYRSVTLRADYVLLGNSGTPTFSWSVKDCVITAGSTSSQQITINVPPGFRYIKVAVSLNGSVSRRYIPMWCHSLLYEPLSTDTRGFSIESDTTESGRDISLKVFGNNLGYSHIAKGTCVYIWREDTYAGQSDTVYNRDKILGWVSEESYTTDEFSDLTLTVASSFSWLSKLTGYGTHISDPQRTPNAWYEMQGINLAKFVHYLLREYTNILELVNYYPPSFSAITHAETVSRSSVWSQIVEVAKSYGGEHVPMADSMGSIWLKRTPHYMGNGMWSTSDERSAIATFIEITEDDTLASKPVSINTENVKKIGRSDVTGSFWQRGMTEPTLIAARAPGATSGQGESADDMPLQRMSSAGQQALLNYYIGQHYARKNSPIDQVVLSFIGNYDVLEPAWQYYVKINRSRANIRDANLNGLYVLKSVQCVYEKESTALMTTWTLERLTTGVPGVTVQIPVGDHKNDPLWDFNWRYNAALPPTDANQVTTPKIATHDEVMVGFAAVTDEANNKVYRTYNFESPSGKVAWDNITPPTINGNIKAFAARRNGEAVNAKVVAVNGTTATIYNSPDIMDKRPKWNVEQTINLAGVDFLDKVVMTASPTKNLWSLAWLSKDAVRCARSINGSGWVHLSTVGLVPSLDTNATGRDLSMITEGNTTLIGGRNALGGYSLFYSDDVNPFTPVAGVPNHFPRVINSIGYLRNSDVVYVSSYDDTVVETIVNGTPPNEIKSVIAKGTTINFTGSGFTGYYYPSFGYESDIYITQVPDRTFVTNVQYNGITDIRGISHRAFGFNWSVHTSTPSPPIKPVPSGGFYIISESTYTTVSGEVLHYTTRYRYDEPTSYMVPLGIVPGVQWWWKFVPSFVYDSGDVVPDLYNPKTKENFYRFVSSTHKTTLEQNIASLTSSHEAFWRVGLSPGFTKYYSYTYPQSRFYRVDNFRTNSPVWTDLLSGSTQEVPRHKRSLSPNNYYKDHVGYIGTKYTPATSTRQVNYIRKSSYGSRVKDSRLMPDAKGVIYVKGIDIVWSDNDLRYGNDKLLLSSRRGDLPFDISIGDFYMMV